MQENRSLSSKWNKFSRRVQYNQYSKSLELEKSAIEHLEKVVFPYLSKKREQLKMPKDKKALLIFDVFKGQTTQQVKDIILENNFVYVFCAEKPHKSLSTILDLNANGQAKQFLICKFESWHADQVTKEIEKGRNVLFVNIETKLSVVKPLHARWLISIYDHMENNCEMIIKAFHMAGITPIAEIKIPDEDPFKNI